MGATEFDIKCKKRAKKKKKKKERKEKKCSVNESRFNQRQREGVVN
jgi:hypothetical protein